MRFCSIRYNAPRASSLPLQFRPVLLVISQNVVMSQARCALYTMLQKIDFLFSIAGPDLQKNVMYVNTEIPRTLTEICPHQGIGSNIMFNDSERSHKESASPYKM